MLTFTNIEDDDAILSKQSKLLRYFNRPQSRPWCDQKYQEYYQSNSFKPSVAGPPKRGDHHALDYTTEDGDAGVARKWVYPRWQAMKPLALHHGHVFCRQKEGGHISRMPIMSPSAGEVHYLRALLSELCPTSFHDMLVDQSNPHQQHKTCQVQHAAIALLMALGAGGNTCNGFVPRQQ